MKKTTISAALVAVLLLGGSCQNQYVTPSAANNVQTLDDINGLIALCNGLQFRYSATSAGVLYASITANGLASRELTVLNAGNNNEEFLRLGGGNVQGNNSVVTNIWTQANLVKGNADLILANVGNPALVGDPGAKSGVAAFANLFRALSLGTLAQYWQQVPIVTAERATFSSREDALREAVRSLEAGAAAIAATPISVAFTSRIASGIDLPNTLQALIARYSIMLGDNEKALAAAGRVNLTVRSFFRYDDAQQNPLFFTSFQNRNVTEPTDAALGLPASLAPTADDRRLAFYLTSTTGVAIGTTNLGRTSFFNSNSATIPIYLPGEMQLIRAEAFARTNRLADAVTELNNVLTGTTDVWGVIAGLPAYGGPQTQEAILTEIYRNRCIELYLSGLKLEDSRRFGRPAPPAPPTVLPATVERNRNFFPYPFAERDNNPNTPANPAI